MDPSHRMRPLAALRALRRLLKDKEDTSQVREIMDGIEAGRLVPIVAQQQ